MVRAYPQISFIIPAFNEAGYIGEAVRSVRKQKTDIPYEIIVVDNLSSDITASIAKENGARVVNENRKGLTFTRQKGFEQSEGEIIIYMDADTRIPENFASEVFKYFQIHKDTVCTSYNYYYYDGRFIDNVFLVIFQLFLPVVDFMLDWINRPEIIVGLIMVMRRNALEKAGGINEKFVFYGEDAQIARSLYTQGKVRHLRSPLVATSARRYKNKGMFKTLALYWASFFLIYFGRLKWAENISQTHRDF